MTTTETVPQSTDGRAAEHRHAVRRDRTSGMFLPIDDTCDGCADAARVVGDGPVLMGEPNDERDFYAGQVTR